MSSARADAINEIFCSYAPEDRPYIEAFRPHLSQLEREGIISCWYDGMIGIGQQWRREIETHLHSANIILLFVSADFLNSDFCMETELSIALERSDRKEALVILVIVRECDWETAQFAHLQVLLTKTTPIAEWESRDKAYTELAKGIRGLVHSQEVPPMRCSLLNLPFHRNRLFTGREGVLQKLHTTLASGKEIALIQAIKGLGGIGKTQTAVEYAYHYQDHYTRIIWLNGESRETITSDVTRLAREINTPDCYDQDQNSVVQGFRTWLERQRNWLLILDNIEDIALARSYMPKSSQGHLLLTTRRQAVGGAIEGIPLDTMDEETGATFLLRRAKRIAVDLPSKQIPAEEMQPARRLSHALGGLPLALDQAGGYIERKQCNLERYLQIYEHTHKRLLAEAGSPEDTTDYKHTVATTWVLSFQQLAQEIHGQAATDLLWICALLSPDNIPVSTFELDASMASEAVEMFGPHLGQIVVDIAQLEDTIEALFKYSLIRRENDVLFIHRLVQTVLRDAMTKEEQSLWTKRTIKIINRVFPDVLLTNWPQCERYLAHALVCADLVEQEEITEPEAARLLRNAGNYLIERAHLREGCHLLQQALSMSMQHLGVEHTDIAEEAAQLELLYRRVLEIVEETYGPKHPEVVSDLNNLANLSKTQGKYAEAEPLFERALTIRRQELGETHPNTAQSMWCLAFTRLHLGKYDKAEPLYTTAFSIFKQEYGLEDLKVQTLREEYVGLLRKLGRHEDADSVERLGHLP